MHLVPLNRYELYRLTFKKPTHSSREEKKKKKKKKKKKEIRICLEQICVT